jgi:lysophospholipase L1-like esterase
MDSLRQNLIIAVTSVALLLCGLEGSVRIFFRIQPTAEKFQQSPQLGWEWTPGYDAVIDYHGDKYRLTVSSQGLRNEEISVPKPAGVYRVIALGDSITEGGGVELDGTFVKLLERSLQIENPEHTIEVINAGTGDYGTEQELIWLRERGLVYEPDLVLLNVYLNDSRSFTPPSSLIATLDNFLIRRSALYFFGRHATRWLLALQTIKSPDFRFRYDDEWGSEAWMTDSDALTRLIQEADQDWGLAWKDEELARIEDGITQMIQIANEHGFELLLVIFSVDVQVYAQVDTPLGLDRPQQELVAFAQRQGIPILDLLPLLRAHRASDLFYDQAHLKPATHQIVADAILQALHKYELGPPP